MSRTYRIMRLHDGTAGGINHLWVLVNAKGMKKYKQMVNKRCRRLDKEAIAEGINDGIDNAEDILTTLEEIFQEDYYDDWYDQLGDPEDWYDFEEPYEEPSEYPYERWDDYDPL